MHKETVKRNVKIKKKLNIKLGNYLPILETINSKNHKSRLIGGVVRDAILGSESGDTDIITTMPPTEVVENFQKLGYKVFSIGIKFGTVSILCKEELFEVTTLRKDISSNGRHAEVQYTKNFYIDALRRDFTVNAISYCPFKEIIYDYFDGIEDLKLGHVKFIGNAESRVQEDYLRILRFFRFWGKFGKEIDLNSLQACIKYRSFIKKLSRERIKSEFGLILSLPKYYNILDLMNESGILQEIFPVIISKSNLKSFFIAEKIAKRLGVLITNETKYALLFLLSNNYSSYNQLINLKFSRKEAIYIDKLINIVNEKNINECLLKEIWLKNDNFAQFFVFLAVFYPEKEIIINIFFQCKNKPKVLFPIGGKEILASGIRYNLIKKELQYLKKKWIESNFKLTRQNLIDILNQKYEK